MDSIVWVSMDCAVRHEEDEGKSGKMDEGIADSSENEQKKAQVKEMMPVDWDSSPYLWDSSPCLWDSSLYL